MTLMNNVYSVFTKIYNAMQNDIKDKFYEYEHLTKNVTVTNTEIIKAVLIKLFNFFKVFIVPFIITLMIMKDYSKSLKDFSDEELLIHQNESLLKYPFVVLSFSSNVMESMLSFILEKYSKLYK